MSAHLKPSVFARVTDIAHFEPLAENCTWRIPCYLFVWLHSVHSGELAYDCDRKSGLSF